MGVNLSGETPTNPGAGKSLFDLLKTGSGDLGAALGRSLDSIATDIAAALRGTLDGRNPFYKISEATKPFRDGQRDLENRVDLLSPLLDYGAVALSRDGNRDTGRLGFTDQIGPMRGVEKLASGGLRFLDKGLWLITLQLQPDQVILDFNIFVRTAVEIRVKRPDGDVYSVRDIITGYGNEHTMTGVMPVVVPDPGYTVEIWCTEIRTLRKFVAGERASILTAQHITRKTDV